MKKSTGSMIGRKPGGPRGSFDKLVSGIRWPPTSRKENK